MQTSSTLCALTSASSTRTTHVWCLRCWSRTSMTSSSTASSARCSSNASGRSCSRFPRRWWSWRVWVSSTLIWSPRTSCSSTPSDSPTESKSSTSVQPVTSRRQCAQPTCSLDTTGKIFFNVLHASKVSHYKLFKVALLFCINSFNFSY